MTLQCSNKSFHIRNLIHLCINQGIVIIFQISTCKTFRKDGPRDVKISANWHFTDNTKNPKNKILTQKITVHGDCCWQINGTVDSITKFPLKADNENSGIYSPNKHNLPYPKLLLRSDKNASTLLLIRFLNIYFIEQPKLHQVC